MKKVQGAILGAFLALTSPSLLAEEIRIGTAVETSSIDPLFYNFAPNLQVSRHIFDYLISKDHRLKLQPELAVSWKLVNPTTWELKLRQGVKWHDGSPFTADDVLFTFDRAPKVTGSASIPGRFVLGKKIEKVDDFTVRVSTDEPYPLMPYDLSTFAIVSKKHGMGMETVDYNTGKAAIGTGPYKFVKWARADELVLEANKEYWGEKPKWDRVVFKPIPSAPSRVAALLNGDVDFIDYVPTADVLQLRKNPKVVLHETPSNRIIFLQCDSSRDVSPWIKTNAGQPMFPNPCRDQRVRLALSKAINRTAIVERVMEGVAVASGQILPEGLDGYNPDLKVETYDPEGAKKLLADAGYKDGFQIALHTPSDRYVNDTKIAETVAQMFSRIGIKTDVMTLPRNVYFNHCKTGGERKTSACSLMILGYGSDTGEPSSTFNHILHTMNDEAGMGNSNRGHYSNDRYDALIRDVFTEVDENKRNELYKLAAEIAIRDLGIIPLHHQMNVWASRPTLTYESRTDEYTLAQSLSKKK
jgi:peptide/nickel transport system substrate-binding protein